MKPGGTGLGLSIALNAIEAVCGRITVEESDMGGSKFCIAIPRQPEVIHRNHELATLHQYVFGG